MTLTTTQTSASDQGSPAQVGSSIICKALLLVILAAGVFFRFHHLASQSLWADEGLTARIMHVPLSQMLHSIISWEQTPPLFYFIEKPIVAIFGDSEFVLRFPSALFSTASILAIYIATKRAFNTKAALVAAMLLAFSPYQIAYAQEARAYALLILLTILSCDLFIHLFQKQDGKLDTAYILVSTALIYTHLYGIFTLIAQQLAFAISRLPPFQPTHVGSASADRLALAPSPDAPGEGRGEGLHSPPSALSTHHSGLTVSRWTTLSIAIAILYAPFLPTVRVWFSDVQHGFWVKAVTWDEISRTYEFYTGSIPLLIATLSLAIIAIILKPKRNTTAPSRSLYFLVASLPVVIPVTLSILTHPTYSARYAMAASVGLYVLAGAGLSLITRKSLFIPATILLLIISFRPTNVPDPKPQWRQAAHYLEQNMHPGDFAAINRKGATCMWDYYVRSRPDVRRIGFDGAALPVTQPLPDHKHIWLILYTNEIPANPMIQRGHWSVGKQKLFRGIQIFELYDTPSDANAQTNEPRP